MPVPPLPLSAIRQPAFLYGPDGRIAAANDRAEALAGRPLIGCSAADVTAILCNRHPDGRRFTPKELPPSRALAGEEVVDVPIVVTDVDGRTVHVLATASPITDGGETVGALVVWQDVSALEAALATQVHLCHESEVRAEELTVYGEELRQQGLALAAAKDELDPRHRLLTAIFETLPYRVSLWDRNERLVWANERFAAEHGQPLEVLIGRDWNRIGLGPAEIAPLAGDARQAAASGGVVSREVEIAGPAGPAWRAFTFLPFGRDALLVICEDIIERKQADRALAFHALLLDRMSDAVVGTDTDLRVTAWNRAAETLYGWSADEAIGRLAREVTGAATTGTERQESLAHLDRGEALPHRTRQHHRDGRLLIIDGRSAPIHDSAGALIGYVAVNRDVTERERLREGLAASEEKYRRLFETMNEGFMLVEPILDEQGVPVSFRHLEVNPAKERISGLTREELVGRDVRDVIPGIEPCWVEVYGRVALTGEPAHLEEYAHGLGVWLSADVYSPEPGKAAVIVTDITARKEAEMALAESEEELRKATLVATRERDQVRNLLEIAGVMILALDTEGRVTLINRRGCELLGRPEEEILGKGWVDHFLPEGVRKDLNDAIHRVMAGGIGEFERNENPVLARDGEERLILWSNRLITDGGGRTVGILSSGEDITERKRAAEALRESEARYRELFESMTEGFALHEVVLDAAGAPVDYRFLAVNPAFETATGLASERIVGRLIREFQPDLDPVWIERYGRVALTGEPDRFVEYFPPLGRWFDIYAFSPAPGRFATMVRDITAERKTTEALRRGAEELEAVMDLVPAAIWVGHDPACRIITGNGLANEFYEAAPGENVSAGPPPDEEASPRVFFAPDGRELAADELPMQVAAARNAVVRNAEFEVQVPSGRRRHLLGAAVPLHEAGGDVRGAVAAFLDITDRKETEEALRRSNEELQRFAYVASHDLQEPLRSIVSFSQLLERRYRGQLGEDADEYIAFIVEGGNRMQTLIQDLLQVSRVETGAKPLEPTDPEAVVYGALRALEAPIREAGASVTVEALPAVMADWSQLEQVFGNLIGNAVKYRRPEVPLEIRVSAGERGGWSEFAVADNGIGIEGEYFDRIFEMFRRLHTHDQYAGTGIGLAVVKRIVERHGGRIRVESTPGEGSTFFFTLPVA